MEMAEKVLTDEQVETVTGYADGANRVMCELGIDRVELDEALLDFNVEKCQNCGWYTDSFNLIDDGDDPDGFCDNCRKYDNPSNAKLTERKPSTNYSKG